jgi:hypothetical protein
LAVFRDAFGPNDMWNHLLLVESESLQQQQRHTKQESYNRILTFLGLSPAPLVDAEDRHKGNYGAISNATQRLLETIYKGSNDQLRDLLAPYGIEMSWTRQ